MPIIFIFDVLYLEFCRARLAEMRKQLSFWPGTPVLPEENDEACPRLPKTGRQDCAPQDRESRRA
jgi:hypothetical protein